MPDYDPKSIPVLDDIIENDKPDAAETSDEKIYPEKISADTNGKEYVQDDDTLDLFSDDTKEAFGATETETAESVLIDYQAEADAENDLRQDDITPDDVSTFDDQTRQRHNITDQPVVSDPSISLDSIVDDVVKQLIPDLEQQLRFLVQQALEEKLPEKIVSQLSAEISSENDK